MRVLILLCLLEATFAFSWNGPTTKPPSEGDPARSVDPTPGTEACHADNGSCSCCLMAYKLHELQTYFDKSLDELDTEFKNLVYDLDRAQEVRSAVSVALHNSQTLACFGPFLTDTTITYEHVFLDLAGDYSNLTGVFVAFASGYYSIALTIYSDAGAPGKQLRACAGLLVNGQIIVGSSDQNQSDQEDSATLAVVVQLQAGDQVSVNLPKGCLLCDDYNHYNTFSVFLLYAS